MWHSSSYSQWWAQVAEWLWSAESPLMIALAFQVCVGWPTCLSERRPFLSGVCQPGEHHWSREPPTHFRALPHLQGFPQVQMWKMRKTVSGIEGSRRSVVQEEWVGIRVPLGEHGAVLTANETLVWLPQVPAIQMMSQLKSSLETQPINCIITFYWSTLELESWLKIGKLNMFSLNCVFTFVDSNFQAHKLSIGFSAGLWLVRLNSFWATAFQGCSGCMLGLSC